MALINHPALFTGGAVEFDSRPHVQLYGQLLARKKAEQETFDEYIRNLNKSINSAGMRNADRQIFDKKIQDWQNFGIQHRDAIRKREGGADIKFQQDYQDILNLVAESKTAEEKKKPLVDILTDPAKRERLSEQIFPEIAAHDEPLYIMDESGQIQRNPNRRDLDYTSVVFNPKQFEQDKYFKQFEDVKRMELPPQVVSDPKTMTQTITTTSVFDDQAKDAIASRAVTDYVNNPSFKATIDKLDPKEYNAVFESNYGRPIQSPADLAAAYTLKGLQQTVKTSKVEPDVFRRQQRMAAIQQANAKELIALRKGIDDKDKEMQDVWIDNYITKLGEEATQYGRYRNEKGETVDELLIPVDAVLAKALEKNKQQPGDLHITSDGRYRPIYFKKDKDGNRIKGKHGGYEIDEELSVPISREQLKLSLGAKSVTPSQRTKEMLNVPKPKKEDDPLGLF